MATSSRQTVTIDALDRRIIHALLLDGRAPFRKIADVLGASEQTVARRYRRLREARVVRVVVLPNPRRFRENLLLRIRVQPGATRPIATALARRDDVSWLIIAEGGTEIACSLRTDNDDGRDDLLLERLPRAGQVVGVTTATLLHVFAETPQTEWHALDDRLTAEEIEALGGHRRRPVATGRTGDEPVLDADDRELIAILARDGRASYAALAAETGRPEAAVARRVDALLRTHVLFSDVELAPALLGFRTGASLWLTVAPAQLDAVATTVAEHPESAFVAAITGPSNLMVAVTCRDTDDLYRYVTRELGALDAIRSIEISRALRQIKRAGTIMDGDLLPDPLAES